VEEACTQAAIATMPCMVREGIEVFKAYYADDEDQKALIGALIEEMKAGGGIPWRDVIILSAKGEHETFLNGLRTLGGVPIRPFDPTVPPDDEAIRYTTVRKFKGLERKAVILVEMESASADFFRRANYVGMTRANVFLAVFLSDKFKQ
jgi:superfamily I DNA/RNA helicase